MTGRVVIKLREHCLRAGPWQDSMVLISVLHDALKTMYNAEKRGKRQVLLRPSSKVVIKFLQVMMKHGAFLLQLRSEQDRMAGFAFAEYDLVQSSYLEGQQDTADMNSPLNGYIT